MGLSWNDIETKKPALGNKLLESVSSNVSSFNPQGIANTLLSLNQMGLSLDPSDLMIIVYLLYPVD